MATNKKALADHPTAEPVKGDDEETAQPDSRRPTMMSKGDGTVVFEGTSENHAALAEAMGTSSTDFQNYALAQLLNVVGDKGLDLSMPGNSALAVMGAVKPTNELEALLAVQMVGCHHLAMLSQQRAVRADDLVRLEAHSNMATKFNRTFVMQMEALAKLRRGGEQVVRHVHVNEGGQAVIAGTVHTGGAK